MRARVSSAKGPRTVYMSARSAVTQPPSSQGHEHVLERRLVRRELRWLQALVRKDRQQRRHGPGHLAHREAPAAGVADYFFDAGEPRQDRVIEPGGRGVADRELDHVLGSKR